MPQTAAAAVTDRIQDYHIHVYYDAASKPKAEALRAKLEATFPEARYGSWHDRPVGPHPEWSYQVHFGKDLFARIVPFVALERGGLTVLVHPNTDDDLADHRDYAMWLGRSPTLNLEIFERRAKA
jgi:aromatic ring-cleaving dioxygenase